MSRVSGVTRAILVYTGLGILIGFLMAWLSGGRLAGLWVLIPLGICGVYLVAIWVRAEYHIRWKNRKLFEELRADLEKEET